MLDIRQDFPILSRQVHPSAGSGHALVYFDNAATTQKPSVVIEAIKNYYENYNANVHRGIHYLSERSTELYDGARETIKKFINARDTKEIIYVRGTTEGINLVAFAWARKNLKAGDEIVLAIVNHHSNIVPWQILAKEKGVILRWINCDEQGNLDLNQYADYLQSGKVKLVGLTHISNALGAIYDVKPLIAQAHQARAVVMLDGAQSAPHIKVDVQDLDCDFFAFSSHKLCGPTGIGVLYGKQELLEAMDPYQGGGDMIMTVEKEGFTPNYLPSKFEAGTPHIAGAVGLKVALDYLLNIGWDKIKAQEELLTTYALAELGKISQVKLYGPQQPQKQIGVIPFTVANIHPHDVAAHLDTFGVAVRAGNHCTQPLHQHLGLNASVRASFYFYNIKEEVDVLIRAVKDCIKTYS